MEWKIIEQEYGLLKQLCATLNALTVAGTKYYNSNYTISYLYLL